MPYTVIGRSENFNQDQEFIGRLANVTFKKKQSNVSSGGRTEDLAKKYFAMLDQMTIQKLYEFYKVDFEMFDYTI